MKPDGEFRIGSMLIFNGTDHEIIGLQGEQLILRDDAGSIKTVARGEWLSAAHDGPRPESELDDRWAASGATQPGLGVFLASEHEKHQAHLLAKHIHELETGYLTPEELLDENLSPNPMYEPERAMKDREVTKLAELKAADLAMSVQTLRRKRALLRDHGVEGLLPTARRNGPTPSVSPETKRVVLDALDEATDLSNRTFAGIKHDVDEAIDVRRQELIDKGLKDEAELLDYGSDSTLRRLVGSTLQGRYLNKSAKTRRSNRRSAESVGQFTALYPGELLYLDTTVLNVQVVGSNGDLLDDSAKPLRPRLSVSLDLYTRLVTAFRITVDDPNQTDAAELMFETVSPPAVSSGWADRLRQSFASVPAERLASVEDRERALLTRPRIWPETAVVDNGKIYTSNAFISACRTLGISVQLARPYRGQDKSPVERFFSSIDSMFCQFVAGYVGRSVEYRGRAKPRSKKAVDRTAAVFTVDQLEDMFEEFLMLEWNHRPHKGLSYPWLEGVDVTPMQMYEAAIATHGALPFASTETDAIALLPVEWRKITQNSSVDIDGRTYRSKYLVPWAGAPSPFPGMKARWPFRVRRDDVTHVYFQNPQTGEWVAIPWIHADKTVFEPFSSTMFAAAKKQVAQQKGTDLSRDELESHRAKAVQKLLKRASRPDRYPLEEKDRADAISEADGDGTTAMRNVPDDIAIAPSAQQERPRPETPPPVPERISNTFD